MTPEGHQMFYDLEEIIEQLKGLDINGMATFYVERAIEQLEMAKEEVSLTQSNQRQNKTPSSDNWEKK